MNGNYVVFSQVEHTVTADLNAALRAAFDESRITDGGPVSVYLELSPTSVRRVATVHAE